MGRRQRVRKRNPAAPHDTVLAAVRGGRARGRIYRTDFGGNTGRCFAIPCLRIRDCGAGNGALTEGLDLPCLRMRKRLDYGSSVLR